MKIRADEMKMLGKREGMGSPASDDDGGYNSAPRNSAPASRQTPAASKAPSSKTVVDDMDDDIPF